MSAISLTASLLLVLHQMPASSPTDAGPPVADAGAAGPSLDDEARFIAGLPVDAGTPLAALEESPWFKRHAAALDAGWSKLETNRLLKMEAWAKEEIAPHIDGSLPLVYLFGGPDIISVDVIYPDAPVYVLAGLERVGVMPSLIKLSPKELEAALDGLRATIRTTIDQSFFITSEVGPNLKRSKLTGVLPVMLLMLARHGDQVLSAETIVLDEQGTATVVDPGAPVGKHVVPGWRVRFSRSGKVRELYYFSQDLENSAIPARPGLFPFLKALGPFNSFLKAASFILHDRHFSTTRQALLDQARSVLQDDSGLPYKSLSEKPWQVTFFGEFTRATGSFADHYQADLKAAWDTATVRPLPFRTGYKRQHGSTMMLGVKVPDVDAGVP